ncbi:ATP-dependent zinc protease [Aquisalimonas sp. 2447]|uniref:ATP-dependent zinc protease family protein n=1 Tax=Aquisalimonas sp. 2447 TaxID=2740807 RepID=UPI0014323DBE|nr:RimK/LysX family protein [Aquisalimonas sp. 2447]QIT54315.1 ATP-dependent zinc protease [Aquisalimonas sp. 2447]
MRKPVSKLTVGWREWAGLPDLDVPEIKIKVDTGALTSALHAIHVHRFTEDERPRVTFEIHPFQRRSHPTIRCTADLVGERQVTSSTGHQEYRPVIRTSILLAGISWPIDLTLTNRDSMGFRMLLGRRAMRRRLLVNPSASFLCGPPTDPDRTT